MDMQVIDVALGATREVIVEPGGALRELPWWRRPAFLDRFEQALVVVLWIALVHRTYDSVIHAHNFYAPIVPISESAVLVFVLLRRPTEAISLDLGAWLLAITATAAPLLIQPGYDMFPRLAAIGWTLLVAGQLVQAGAKFSLRRSFGIAPANRGIKANGLYRFVRHPMYAGYLMSHIAIMTLMPSPVNAALYGIGWIAQIRRLLAEEALLGQDPAYRAYCARVRWRLVPGVF